MRITADGFQVPANYILEMADSSNAIFLAFSEDYAVAGRVAVESALHHAPEGTSVVIGHVDLNHSTIRRFERVAARHGAPLHVVPVGAHLSGFPAVGRYPVITWTRTLAAEILGSEVARAVYLDADVLVRAPLDPLFDIDLGRFPLAAAPDFDFPTHGVRGTTYVKWAGTEPDRPYFNSGVLVIDVHRWAQLDVHERVRRAIGDGQHALDYVDQDALNATLHGQWVELDRLWNVPANRDQRTARIVQFIGETKPWDHGATGPFVDEFAMIAART